MIPFWLKNEMNIQYDRIVVKKNIYIHSKNY